METPKSTATPAQTTEATTPTGFVPPPDADEYVHTIFGDKLTPKKVQQEALDEVVEEKETESIEKPQENKEEKKEASKDDDKPVFKPTGEMHVIKVDGKDLKLPYEELIARAQKAVAADKRMQEAGKLKNEIVNVMKWLKNDPMKVLLHPSLGFKKEDIRQKMESWLFDEISYDKMTPEEKKHYDEVQELKRYKQQEEERKMLESERLQNEMKEKVKGEYIKQIKESITENGLIDNAFIAGRIAYHYQTAKKQGYNINFKQAGQLVKEEVQGLIGNITSTLDADKLTEVIGKDAAKKLREGELKKAKAKEADTSSSKQTSDNKFPKKQEAKKMTMEEFRKQIQRIS